MRGQMMELPLTITSILRHATTQHGRRAVVSWAGGAVHRSTYGELFARAARVAGLLRRLGIHQGDRVGTLAWNDFRHLELYYGVSCSGAVLHTVNPRLFPEQVGYIVHHGGDRVVFTDPAFVPLLEKLQDELRAVECFVVLCDEAAMPATTLRNAACYEALLAREPDDFRWPDLDEHAACSLCYTSGTTGHPKGVVYSHRSTVLHSYATALPDVLDLRARDTLMAVVPMFHVNAWGTPYTAPLVGAKLVLPGPAAGDPARLAALVAEEGVTATLGVPTVWLALLEHLRRTGTQVPTLQRIVVGGAACPAALIEGFAELGISVQHAWGMTEMSPLGTYNAPKATEPPRSADEAVQRALRQGRAIFGVELKIVDDAGAPLPWDGRTSGRLLVRGPWVCSGYYRPEEGARSHDAEGWFETGDVAAIDPEGFMQITDRTKDLIKSGGEWISSLELENIAMSHAAVAEAAVIGVPDATWSERPLLVVVRRPGATPTAEDLRAWFDGKVAKFCIPDRVEFVDAIPHTATGKVSKVQLRERFAAKA